MTAAEIAALVAQRDMLLLCALEGWRTAKIVSIHAGLAASEKAANRALDALDQIVLNIRKQEEAPL